MKTKIITIISILFCLIFLGASGVLGGLYGI